MIKLIIFSFIIKKKNIINVYSKNINFIYLCIYKCYIIPNFFDIFTERKTTSAETRDISNGREENSRQVRESRIIQFLHTRELFIKNSVLSYI